jgi:hypothetical protein
MRFFRITLALATFVAGLSFAQEHQGAKDDMKDAGHATKEAAKSTGRATKKTGKKVARGTKKVVNIGADKTAEGANKVEEKTR